MLGDRIGPTLTITGTCEKCCHVGRSIVARSCHSPLLSEPRFLPRAEESPTPAWCPELPGARLALAREIVTADIVGPAVGVAGARCAVGMDGPWLWGGCNRLDGKCRERAREAQRKESE